MIPVLLRARLLHDRFLRDSPVRRTRRRGALMAAGLLAALSVAPAPASARQSFDPDRAPTIVAADEAFSFEFYASAALRAYPALATLLLKAAGEDGVRFAADAARDLREFGEEPLWRRRVLSLTDQTLYNSENVISVLRVRYMDGGGAHPNVDYASWLWRIGTKEAAGEVLPIGALFRDGVLSDSLVQAWLSALSAAKKARLGDEALSYDDSMIASAAGALHERPFTLWPSTTPGRAAAIVFHHEPYDVGAYAEGPYDVLVPLSAFEDDLSALGKQIFAGEPQAENP